MRTRKPLIELIPDLLMYFQTVKDQMQFDFELYKMHEGQIREKVEQSLAKEMLSKSAYRRAIQRIPSINIIKKVTDKLSKVYSESPARFSEVDKELIEQFANEMNLNSHMAYANRLSNLNRRAALELYVADGKHQIRVLAAHQFFVWSDSPIAPLTPTVFVKMLGRDFKRLTPVASVTGRRLTEEEQVRQVDLMAVYTDTEFMIIDSDGTVRTDKMQEMGATSTVNPFGTIPFIYINKSKTELLPYPNQTAFDIGILIPKLLTDLNYSAQFMSHSVIYTKNVDTTTGKFEINPDAIVDLGDTDAQTGAVPEIGTITPTVDIAGILSLVEFELGAYMNTEGVKTAGIGKLEEANAASGISKLIDESDASEARKEQTELFRQVEQELWSKFAQMQQVWSSAAMVTKQETFNPDFIDSFSVKFADIKPLETEKEKYDKLKVAKELHLITRKQALKEIYPNLSAAQIDERLQEIEEEMEKDKERQLAMGLTPGFTQLDRQRAGVSDEMLVERVQNGGTETE